MNYFGMLIAWIAGWMLYLTGVILTGTWTDGYLHWIMIPIFLAICYALRQLNDEQYDYITWAAKVQYTTNRYPDKDEWEKWKAGKMDSALYIPTKDSRLFLEDEYGKIDLSRETDNED